MIIQKIVNYTIPLFGNTHCLPYGSLLIAEDQDQKIVKIKDDGGKQYFTYKRKRYYIRNTGSLYSPHYELS